MNTLTSITAIPAATLRPIRTPLTTVGPASGGHVSLIGADPVDRQTHWTTPLTVVHRCSLEQLSSMHRFDMADGVDDRALVLDDDDTNLLDGVPAAAVVIGAIVDDADDDGV